MLRTVFPYRVPLCGQTAARIAMWCLVLLCAGDLQLTAQPPRDPPQQPVTAPQRAPATVAAPAARTGTVSGTVTGPQGALVSGAMVTLTSPGLPAGMQTLSGDSGRFFFNAVPPGTFTVSVSLQGFDPAKATGTVAPGSNDELAPFSLQIATVNFVVNAVTSEQELQIEQLHAEEKQRLIGIFPNFFVSYQWNAPPLTSRQKFVLATKNAIDPGNLFLVGTVAGVQQADNAFPGYHQGAAGYGKRYGADLANLVVGTYMGGAVLPVLFRQDPRYFYKGTGTIKSRFLYAISTAVICRGDNGHRQPAFASVLGDISAGAISNLYYAPSDRQGARLTLINGFLGIAGDAMNNVFQEFFLKKLTPKVRNATSSSAP